MIALFNAKFYKLLKKNVEDDDPHSILKYLTDDALTNSFGRSIQVLRQRNRKKDYQADNILDGSKNFGK